MPDELKVISIIAPDLMADIGRRAQVLSGIESMQPVGRRALAARLNLPVAFAAGLPRLKEELPAAMQENYFAFTPIMKPDWLVDLDE